MSAASVSPITVCTLWEKDHHKGVATLVNSLVRFGYRGRVWTGYKGDLPAWAAGGVTQADTYIFSTGSGVEVVFVKVPTDLHFAQYKPTWMLRVLEEFEPDAQGVYYFDPDMFVVGAWTFFERWLTFGIAACEDVGYPFNPNHPLALGWRAYASQLGYTHWNEINAYFNSGLVGVSREMRSFLRLWDEVMNAIRRDFGAIEGMRTPARTDLFHRPGQDGFTLATYLTTHPVSWVGPDGMAFERGEWLTVHAYLRKPWRRKVLLDLLVSGEKPDRGARLYWELAGAPIQVESAARIRRHRWLVPLAAFLSRFYQRRG
ncbi:hypothetical protein [Granulicella mallensis]|uniref:Uncharacterized protein n=1 Tax=Granulicella mallensis (strain ATCC BAA-1857 / DSM 23137 / MP5ACTX8) TaxID=682795 RepID=G8P093_GRAMM|nr:hypothetical protein [Granulicella mallensis]AEU36887.1 hypothetical protein AciX8_2574 [Granulicella mallensis MP5ACTX8]